MKPQIRIDNPCDASWEKMNPTEAGKFCKACEKEVTDFTKFTDQELKDYFKTSGRVKSKPCGRFRLNQLSPMMVEIPVSLMHQSFSTRQIVILSILICFGVTFSSCKVSNPFGKNRNVETKLVAKLDSNASTQLQSDSAQLDSNRAIAGNTLSEKIGVGDSNASQEIDSSDSSFKIDVENLNHLFPELIRIDLENYPMTGMINVVYGDINGGFGVNPEKPLFPQLPIQIGNLNEPLIVVDQYPMFAGGVENLNLYYQNNLVFPKAARKQRICGTAYIQFTVDEKGAIHNPIIVKSLGKDIDEEVVRLVSNMPNWIPGEDDGKAVCVSVILPIDFKCDPSWQRIQ